MTVCYNKLWKLLIDKNMKKIDLRLATGMLARRFSPKFARHWIVTSATLLNLCRRMTSTKRWGYKNENLNFG